MAESSPAPVDIETVKLAMSMITPVVSQDMEASKIANQYMNEAINSPHDVAKLLASFVLISSLLVKVAKAGYEAEKVDNMALTSVIGGLMVALENQYG